MTTVTFAMVRLVSAIFVAIFEACFNVTARPGTKIAEKYQNRENEREGKGLNPLAIIILLIALALGIYFTQFKK